MRVAHYLAQSGIASRRKCEEFIEKGLVKVNGKLVVKLGTTIDPEEDIVMYREQVIQRQDPVWLVMNKPTGYVVTAHDNQAKKKVFELLPKKFVARSGKRQGVQTRVFPVGRLDKDTSGLLLFTNQGHISNKLIHPKHGVGKFYEVRLHRAWDSKDGGKILKGLRFREGVLRVESFRPLTKRIIKVELHEGKYRHIRRLFERLEYKVVDLHRIQFGPIKLSRLAPGQVRFLNKKEIDSLKKAIR